MCLLYCVLTHAPCQRDNATFNAEVRKVLARTVGEAMTTDVVRTTQKSHQLLQRCGTAGR
jgi:hypothetical protein